MATATQDKVHGFEPFGMDFRNDPHRFYPELLAHSPMRVIAEGAPAVVISKFRQVKKVLSYPKLFSSVKPAGTPGMEKVDFFNSRPVMNYCDPPEHNRLRQIVAPAFSPRSVRDVQARAQAIADEMLDALGDHPTFDGVADLGFPFSRRVLMNSFMGIPPEDEHIYLRWLYAVPLLGNMEPGDPKPKEFLDAWEAGTAHCVVALERARNGDRDNIISMIAGADESGKISKDDIMATMMVLFAGGLTTVSATVGACLLKLTEYPDIAERVRQDPSLALRFFEETLRLNPALTSVMRFPTHDMDIEGMWVEKDTPLYVMLSAACFDPEEFPDPYSFDIDRPNNKEHAAFGAGQHTCIGNVIARAVVPPLIADCARRWPNLHRSAPDQPLPFDVGNPRVRHLAGVGLTA